jgi:cytochrome c
VGAQPQPPAHQAEAQPTTRPGAAGQPPAGQQGAAQQGKDLLAVTPEEYTGWKYFHVYCYRCHGTDAFGGQLAPDLRHSVGPEGSVTRDVFIQTVTNGRPTKGMPTWGPLLTQEQILGLYAYVKARSEGRLAPGRPHVKGQ